MRTRLDLVVRRFLGCKLQGSKVLLEGELLFMSGESENTFPIDDLDQDRCGDLITRLLKYD